MQYLIERVNAQAKTSSKGAGGEAWCFKKSKGGECA